MEDKELKRRVQGCYTELKQIFGTNEERVLFLNSIMGRWFEDILYDKKVVIRPDQRLKDIITKK